VARTIDQFRDLWLRSRLTPPAKIQEACQRWQVVAVKPDSPADFLAWLVANKHLTEYQAEHLGDGHADNFFLGQYKILERVGKGRMAGVYKALDLGSRPVALKVLPPSKARDSDTLARFQREARLAMQLRHPNVVSTVDCGESRGVYFLVMEYLEGQTLEELLRERRRLRPREAARLGFLASLGLQHVHERGMVHRDLKPANLMLAPAPAPHENTLRSMVKILDIGLGRQLYDPANQKKDELTNEGAILGTPDYLAPEQARDPRRADIRADLYGLGCVMYHALTGVPPFADENLVRQMVRHAKESPRPLQELVHDVPKELNQVVQTMLAKDPAKRYQTPAQAAEAMKRFLATKG
jgi:eukaryotic-like serine/threonine-protein kinase